CLLPGVPPANVPPLDKPRLESRFPEACLTKQRLANQTGVPSSVRKPNAAVRPAQVTLLTRAQATAIKARLARRAFSPTTLRESWGAILVRPHQAVSGRRCLKPKHEHRRSNVVQ